MNSDDNAKQHTATKAPPPSAFLPPPPAMMSSSSAGTGGHQSQQSYATSGFYQQQLTSSGIAPTASASTSYQQPHQHQPPPPLTTEGKTSSGAVAKQFSPPAPIPTFGRPGNGRPGISRTSITAGFANNVAPNNKNAAPSLSAASSTTSTPSTSPNKAVTDSLYPPASSSGRYPATSSSYTGSQYPSPYLPTPSQTTNADGSTLKARNVISSGNSIGAATTSAAQSGGGGYLLSNPSSSDATPIAGSRTKIHSSSNIVSSSSLSKKNNNTSIACLMLPSLLYLFLYEMSSSLPLLVFLCLGLIVYSFDLANVGDNSSSSSGGSNASSSRGYYTLIAIWMSWIVLSLIVGYDVVFLSEASVSNTLDSDQLSNDEGGAAGEGGDSFITNSGSGISNLYGLSLLLTKLSVFIILIFNLSTWTTLQFAWLPHQMPVIATFFERILYSTLPPVSAAMTTYGLFAASTSLSWGTTMTGGVDSLAMLVPHVFALHLTLGILVLGAAPSMLGLAKCGAAASHDNSSNSNNGSNRQKSTSGTTIKSHICAIHSGEGRRLSYLLVFLPLIIHVVIFWQRITYSYASWDDLFDLILIVTVPYTLHYLLASNGVFDERWRRSLPWVLQVGTSPAEGGERTLRGASVPMTISLLGSMAFQHQYLVPLCARVSYIMNGHDGIISSTLATTFLTCGTVLAYATVWFFGRKDSNGEFLMGEYHEDFFQLLLALSSVSYGLSCSPKWTFLPVPMLLGESLALWVITKQLRYAVLTAFVMFTVGTIIVAYRLTFLSEVIEILPGKTIVLKKFAEVAMYASLWLILLVGLVIRAPGGYWAETMRKIDVTGICWITYLLVLVVLECALLRQPMPLYSRDNFEVGRVAVYSPMTAYFTTFLTLLITWHMKAQKLIKDASVIGSTSIVFGKMLAVVIESGLVDSSYNSVRMLFLRWAVASLLLITICAPYLLKPIHVKMHMSGHAKKRKDPSAKPSSLQGVPNDASWTVVVYCAVLLPVVIISSVRLVLEPLIGLLSGQTSSPKLSEVIGYSASLWGISVVSMINHFLPDGGADIWRRVSALTFIMGLFVSFSAPAFPGTATSSWDNSHVFQSVSSLDTENDVATGGWGLVSAFLAILLAMSGPLELREIRSTSGRRDTRQLLRLMIFGMMFGCGLSWFITMQSMSKDIFIPIFVTTFSCMAMSTLGTVASVMGYFLEAREFVEVEQIAHVWAGVAFPVFFVISSISLSAHAHPFGIGGWASTYLSVCGLLAGAFCVLVRLRDEKTSTTRGYGNISCVISWLCAIIVVYGRYGVAGVGVVGTTSVAGVPASVIGTLLCSPILLLLEGEGSGSNKTKYQISSTKSRKKGLVLTNLTRSNWFAPLLAGTVAVFLASTFYAIFLRGCGFSKLNFIFGTGEAITSQEDVFSHVYGSSRRSGMAGALDDVATMARKSAVHTKTMVAAAKLSSSGIWTSNNMLGPVMHLVGLLLTVPSLKYLVSHSWYGSRDSFAKVKLSLPLNLLAMFIGRGIPSLGAAAVVGFLGGLMQLLSHNS